MNQKKCPKCGEMNPPEAVMCWACYTPLTGTAAVAPPVAGGRSVAPAASKEEKEKPKIPVLHLGIIGAAVVVGLIYGGMMMFGGSSNTDVTESPGIPKRVPRSPTVPTNPNTTNISIASPSAPTNSVGTVPPTNDVPYTVLSSPSPKYDEGVMTLLAKQPNVSSSQAAGMAAAARRRMVNPDRWKPLHIFVFSNEQSARAFMQRQATRGNQPLSSNDYASLTAIWPGTLVRYEWLNNRERIAYPASNPTGWWQRTT